MAFCVRRDCQEVALDARPCNSDAGVDAGAAPVPYDRSDSTELLRRLGANMSDKNTLSFSRLINIAALLGLLGVLAGSLHLQFGVGEQPCPLCLVQRSAMIGLAGWWCGEHPTNLAPHCRPGRSRLRTRYFRLASLHVGLRNLLGRCRWVHDSHHVEQTL